ncbi:MAG: type II secretion system major pseudopilin GspG [Gemmatimonadaceae bacterium]|nr:type II secretion system major pseudopilin GspG [Gemmatimonadaceae bacterium]
MRRHRWRPSILEVLAGMLAIGIAATFVAPQWFRAHRPPRETAQSDMKVIGAALETYRHDTGAYPTSGQGLDALLMPPTVPPTSDDWWGPYILTHIPTDPWGSAYVYRRVDNAGAEGYALMSYGADGRPGGSGDDADVVVRR